MIDDRLTSKVHGVEAALFGLTVTDILFAEDERIHDLARELERVSKLISTEIWTRERDAPGRPAARRLINPPAPRTEPAPRTD